MEPHDVAVTWQLRRKSGNVYALFSVTAAQLNNAATVYPVTNKVWMYFVPLVGQQALMTDVLGGKAPAAVFFAAAGILNVAIAIVLVRITTALLHREKIIFGR